MKARLLLEDLSSDLMDANVFDNVRFTGDYREISSAEDFQKSLGVIQQKIVDIREKFKIKFIEKIAHFWLSVKIGESVSDVIVFPLIDRSQTKVKEKIEAWD